MSILKIDYNVQIIKNLLKDSQLSTLEPLISDLISSIAAFPDLTSLSTEVSEIHSSVTTVLEPGVSNTLSILSVVETGVSTVSSAVSVVDTGVSTVSSAVSVVDIGVSTVSSAVSVVDTGVSTVSSAVSVVDTGVSTVSSAVSVVNTGVSSVISSVSVVDIGVSEVNSNVISVGTDVSSIFVDVSNVSSGVSDVYVAVGIVSTEVSVVNTTVSFLKEDVLLNDSYYTSPAAIEFNNYLSFTKLPLSDPTRREDDVVNTPPVLDINLKEKTGAFGVIKHVVYPGFEYNNRDEIVFEKYFNGNNPDTLYSTFSCGKELLTMFTSAVFKKGYTFTGASGSTTFTRNTTVADIIYGTDIVVYGTTSTNFTLPKNLETATMAQLLNFRTGGAEVDELLFWLKAERDTFAPSGYTFGVSTNCELNDGYVGWVRAVGAANPDGSMTVPMTPSITGTWGNTFDDLKNPPWGLNSTGPTPVGTSFRYYINYLLKISVNPVDNLLGLKLFQTAFFTSGGSNSGRVLDLLLDSSTRTNNRFQRQNVLDPVQNYMITAGGYGSIDTEVYNNTNFYFISLLVQLVLLKVESDGGDLTIDVTSFAADVTNYTGSRNGTLINHYAEIVRTYLGTLVLAPAGVGAKTKSVILQSNDNGTILFDFTKTNLVTFLKIGNLFSSELYKADATLGAASTTYFDHAQLIAIRTMENVSSSILRDAIEGPHTDNRYFDSTTGFQIQGSSTLPSDFLRWTNGIWASLDMASFYTGTYNVPVGFAFDGLGGQTMTFFPPSGWSSSSGSTGVPGTTMTSMTFGNNIMIVGEANVPEEYFYENRNGITGVSLTADQLLLLGICHDIDPILNLQALNFPDVFGYILSWDKNIILKRNLTFDDYNDLQNFVRFLKNNSFSTNTWFFDSTLPLLLAVENYLSYLVAPYTVDGTGPVGSFPARTQDLYNFSILSELLATF